MDSNEKAKASSENKHAIGLKTVIRILEKWNANIEQACAILGVSSSLYAHAKSAGDANWPVILDSEAKKRIGIVLNIHGALRVVFDNPENVYGFMSMKNDNEFFDGRTPLEVIAQGDYKSLYETMVELVDDAHLAGLVKERQREPVVMVDIDELTSTAHDNFLREKVEAGRKSKALKK